MKQSRREFLKTAATSLGAGALATSNFGVISSYAMGGCDPEDYKALVIIFLAGGNDGNNMLVPKFDVAFESYLSNWGDYSALRGPLAIPQNSLLSVNVPSLENLEYGLHPSLGVGIDGGLHGLWDKGKIAIVGNVGTLAAPTTKTQYLSSGHPKPYSLFSHSDQIEQNQTAQSKKQIFTGWGGRLSNNLGVDQNTSIPPLISIAGAQMFTSGGTINPLAVADAQTDLNALFTFEHTGSTYTSVKPGYNGILSNTTPASTFVKGANQISTRAVHADEIFTQHATEVGTPFPATGIGNQLKQVARLIKVSHENSCELLINRQIYFCQLGGFDTHAYQLAGQAGLLAQFSDAAKSFYVEMDEQKLSDRVTSFTMSDFSRTMVPNGTGASAGTDHAWGSHALVFGGAVTASDVFGVPGPLGFAYPHLNLQSDLAVETHGRWIPTTSVEEYAYTLAKWIGLDPANKLNVFPNIQVFHNDPTREGYLNFI